MEPPDVVVRAPDVPAADATERTPREALPPKVDRLARGSRLGDKGDHYRPALDHLCPDARPYRLIEGLVGAGLHEPLFEGLGLVDPNHREGAVLDPENEVAAPEPRLVRERGDGRECGVAEPPLGLDEALLVPGPEKPEQLSDRPLHTFYFGRLKARTAKCGSLATSSLFLKRNLKLDSSGRPTAFLKQGCCGVVISISCRTLVKLLFLLKMRRAASASMIQNVGPNNAC